MIELKVSKTASGANALIVIELLNPQVTRTGDGVQGECVVHNMSFYDGVDSVITTGEDVGDYIEENAEDGLEMPEGVENWGIEEILDWYYENEEKVSGHFSVSDYSYYPRTLGYALNEEGLEEMLKKFEAAGYNRQDIRADYKPMNDVFPQLNELITGVKKLLRDLQR